mmetsp:Transcript_42531/g.136457  ORF Transcript_42531/g.136457 Transcript_42531/m.136457 type:complete len:88 (+) Transcript_42531:339-602(+)
MHFLPPAQKLLNEFGPWDFIADGDPLGPWDFIADGDPATSEFLGELLGLPIPRRFPIPMMKRPMSFLLLGLRGAEEVDAVVALRLVR